MKQIGKFDPVYHDSLGGAIVVQGERIPRATEDFEGPLVLLLEGPPDTVDSEEDVEAAIEVLAAKTAAFLGMRGCTGQRLAKDSLRAAAKS